MIPAPILGTNNIIRFLYAGRAVFTLVSKRTGTRYTYRARKGETVLLVDLLTAPDTFTYIGLIRDGRFRPYKGQSNPGIAWFTEMLHTNNLEALSRVEFWHAGTCAKCGKILTDPASITRGLGPKCAEKI